MTDTDATPEPDTTTGSAIEAPALTEAPAAVPVLQATPSNESVTPEAEPAVEEQHFSFKDAVRNLVAHVRDGRRAGDSDVEATLADVEKHL